MPSLKGRQACIPCVRGVFLQQGQRIGQEELVKDQENKVHEENWDHALFAEMGTSRASMEAAKRSLMHTADSPSLRPSSLQENANVGLVAEEPVAQRLGREILETHLFLSSPRFRGAVGATLEQ